MVIRTLKKYYALVAGIICTLLFFVYLSSVHQPNHKTELAAFEESLHEQIDDLDEALGYVEDDLMKSSVDELWQEVDSKFTTNFHVYRNDSLIYWNTNQLPILRSADIHFPSAGLLHLQNGWYYAEIREVNDYVVCATFLIKHEYSYENRELINSFSPDFSLSFAATIGLEEERGFAVHDEKGEYIFSIVPDEIQEIKHGESVAILLLLLGTISFWLLWLTQLQRKWPRYLKVIMPIVLLGIRIASLHWGWFSFLEGTEMYDPSLYGANVWLPNFAEYTINIVFLVYMMYQLRLLLKLVKGKSIGKWLILLIYLTSVLLWSLLVYLSEGLISDSSIPLVIDQLFELNIYSVFTVSSLGIYFFCYYLLVRDIIRRCKELDWNVVHLAVITFLAGCVFMFYELNYGNQIFINGLFPMAFYGVLLYIVYRFKVIRQLGSGLILLFLFSLVTSVNMAEFNRIKERSERELYANQVATEKNIVTEAEYAQLAQEIAVDNALQRFIGSPQTMSVSDFQEGMERRLFNGFWERYEMSFSLFDEDKKPLIEYRQDPNALYGELQGIIDRSGVPSEIDPNIYFISDYSGQYSYIIRQPIKSLDTSMMAILFCTLKSKKIPEEIGFPRLLISQQTSVLETLEAYSIAKYHEGQLVTKYGDFNYPSSHLAMVPDDINVKGFFDYSDYNHYVHMQDGNDVVVLSSKNFTLIDQITAFSYLFSFYGLLLLPFLFRLSAGGSARKTFSLAMKIQLVLISLVFLSLLAFGWGSGIFVSNQYNQYTNDVIREKLNSVQTEVRAKLGDFEELSIYENGNYMQHILQKFAKVFFTDINLYDNDGYLLGTSRPKVFNVGLLSEQMNPTAYKFMKYNQKSEFVHNESIGELDYSSAYLPFYNNNGKRMGFINLQHFGQQREFESQIQKFLVAIINVFILLLAISILLAIFISAWLTAPLRILQESFAGVKFGKHNEQILYDREDEIGALVKDYNQKLLELEFAAQQLARSERESAWREMAKQVAHEIKNPLTPMKLSVQQLLRVYDPDDPKSGEKLKKVANSMIEQIDALTNIANEFSSFAKMPNPHESELNVVALVRGVSEVFESQAKVQLELTTTSEEIYVMADKDQFVRVFNNLIKNAIQAIPAERDGLIHIDFKTKDEKVFISIKDNGIGIDPSKEGKIFVPYFTTKSTGTGLGLAMVKQIIENHRGTIDFETEVNVGTTFKIELPVAT